MTWSDPEEGVVGLFGLESRPVRESLHNLKYNGIFALADELIEIVSGSVLEEVVAGVDVLLPVPTSPKRERQRGYNQAQLLAEAIARRAGVPVAVGNVRKMERGTQVGRSAGDRERELEGAFQVVHAAELQGRHVLVVDDVYTTGATMRAVMRQLQEAGVGSVRGLAVARAGMETGITNSHMGSLRC